MKRYLVIPLFLVLLPVLTGCGTRIGTRQIGYESAYRRINTNALLGRAYSITARKVLLRYNLESAFRSDPKATLTLLQDLSRRDNRRDLLFALAELNYHAAGGPVADREKGFHAESRAFYLNAAVFAWFYLFEPGLDGPVDPYDRNFRWACDTYNLALARALTDASGTLDFRDRTAPLPEGAFALRLDQAAYPWDPAAGGGTALAADELAVRGLTHRNRDSGIGVPFIVEMDSEAGLPVKRSLPGTLLLRVEGGLSAFHNGRATGRMELHTPLETGKVEIAGKAVPLERDISVQLAHTLNQPLVWDVGLREFFTGKSRFKNGLYEIIPHSPGKIPVVFVHGTFSNPVAWAEMANTLMADPVIRNRFEFWFYLYDSNRPVVLSALYFRGALRERIAVLDPGETDVFLRQMVVIGHSQGGLLTKLTATDTGDRIIREVAGKGLDELDLTPDQRALMERTAVLEPLPFVRRVVFISTPHRGSRLVNNWVRDLVRRVVSLPSDILATTSEVMAAIPEENIPDEWRYEKTITSIDSMAPDNPTLLALSRIPPADGIRSHSIIAVQGDGDPKEGSDGVVTYKSAHLDYTDSEFIVQPCGHSSQWHPLAIEEVRRILRLHLTDVNTQQPE